MLQSKRDNYFKNHLRYTILPTEPIKKMNHQTMPTMVNFLPSDKPGVWYFNEMKCRPTGIRAPMKPRLTLKMSPGWPSILRCQPVEYGIEVVKTRVRSVVSVYPETASLVTCWPDKPDFWSAWICWSYCLLKGTAINLTLLNLNCLTPLKWMVNDFVSLGE